MNASEEGPLIDLVLAGAESGSGEIDVDWHPCMATYPPLAREDAMMNMIDVADDLLADRDLAPAFLETGLLGSDDFLILCALDAGNLYYGCKHRSIGLPT